MPPVEPMQSAIGAAYLQKRNRNKFKAPSGAEYAAPTGLENCLGGSSTQISLLTELGAGVRLQRPPRA